MKKFITLIIVASLIFTSCKQHKPTIPAQSEAPKPLQENQEINSIGFSKRYPQNLLEELYNDLLKKDKSLDSLDKQISKIAERKRDSIADFLSFDEKNKSYYNEADQLANTLTDSVLKHSIQKTITDHIAGYKSKTMAYNNLLETLQRKNIVLSEMYAFLRIIKTLDVMYKYQQDNIPFIKPAEKINKEYDQLIQKTKNLTGN